MIHLFWYEACFGLGIEQGLRVKMVREKFLIFLVICVSLGFIQVSQGLKQEQKEASAATSFAMAPGALRPLLRANFPENLDTAALHKAQKQLSDVVHECMKSKNKADKTCKALWAAIYL